MRRTKTEVKIKIAGIVALLLVAALLLSSISVFFVG